MNASKEVKDMVKSLPLSITSHDVGFNGANTDEFLVRVCAFCPGRFLLKPDKSGCWATESGLRLCEALRMK